MKRKIDGVFPRPALILREIGPRNAGFDDSGKDLVCAGASSISIGALNALDQLFKNDCILEMKENRISIKVKESKEGLEQVLRCIVIQLETMVESYPEYIRIIRKEV